MAIDKIQAEGINLADTFAFTGTVTGAGNLTLLNTTTLSSSTSATIQGLMTGYDNYLVLYKLTRSTNSIPRLTFLSGATELTSGYHSQGVYGSGSSAGSTGDDGQSFINLTSTYSDSWGATAPVSGHIFIIDPDDASDVTSVVGQNTIWSSSSNLIINNFTGSSTTAQAQDGLKFTISTGNYVDGFIKLYGIT